MVDRKWAYRELFDRELDAAHAYDAAVMRLKPREAAAFVNFEESLPPHMKRASSTPPRDTHQLLGFRGGLRKRSGVARCVLVVYGIP